MYRQEVFDNVPWYQCLDNHDGVLGQSSVDFQTKATRFYDGRWYFGTLVLRDFPTIPTTWSAPTGQPPLSSLTLMCFLDSYQSNTSVYHNAYTTACHGNTNVQVDFLNQTFSESNATWKFLQLHHPYVSVADNETGLLPLMEVVIKHNGIVLNDHDHCLGHFFFNDTNFVLSGAAGYPQAGDHNNGTAQGPCALYLGANNLTATNGFVAMDVSSTSVAVEYYARDMKFENGDLYPVSCDLNPSYSFDITKKAI